MATLSITKNISIKTRKSSSALAFALENAENKKSKKVVLKRPLNELKGADIDKLFRENNDRV